MAKLLPAFVLALLIIVALNLLAGGSSPRQLLSVTVALATANVSDFSNGMVQFTATGMFDRIPSPATLNPATWDLIPSTSYPADAVSFSTSGVAQCKAEFAGTVTVRGGAFVCPQNSMMGVPCRLVFGTAQLTCP